MDEEKKQELKKAVAVMREYCKDATCKECELDKAEICGWATPPSTWPDID